MLANHRITVMQCSRKMRKKPEKNENKQIKKKMQQTN